MYTTWHIIQSIMVIKLSALKEFDCPLDQVECFSLELILDPIKYKFEYVILAMFKYITCVMNILHWKLECITHYTSSISINLRHKY